MTLKKRGFFISIEKTKEGLGGTTQAQKLADNLREAGYEVILTCEPGGTKLGRHIRELLLHTHYSDKEGMSKASELFLFMADRAQHYKEVLKPGLKSGAVVISDRYVDSTLVYQGSGRGWKSAFLLRLHHAATGSLIPDLTIVLDGSPHVPRDTSDRIEAEPDSYHERIARGMRHLVTKNPQRYEVVNANIPLDELAKQLFDLTIDRLVTSKSAHQEPR